MSKISLRAYTRDIDTLIDLGQIDEAIGHCRHILSKFPKHIDTYRLLGKAYLEGNQNSNAADIFQRVLSAIPDDFVSHIGMSLIREEEGNLQSAINHMERAFERQPYNNAIQEEIRRLYGKRDGIEPPKVRLTQGALARMYLKGGLISQGIAELRSALAEQPERFDLRTLLAKAYQSADETGKAIETASVILKRFPFNLIANRILAQTLKTHDHPEEMAICRKRLYALSPYEAYVSEHAPTVEEVPDQAITLEKLDAAQIEEDYSLPTEADVDWEIALGEEEDRDQEAGSDEAVPDWLAGLSEEELADAEGEAEADTDAPLDEEASDITADQEQSLDLGQDPDEETVPDWLAGMPEGELAEAEGEAEADTDAPLDEDISGITSDQDQGMDLDKETDEETMPDSLAGLPAEDIAEEPPSPTQSKEIEATGEESPSADAPPEEDTTEAPGAEEQLPVDEFDQMAPETTESDEQEIPVLEPKDSTPLDEDSEEDLAEEIDFSEKSGDEDDESIPEWMEEAGWEASGPPAGKPDDIYAEEDMEDDDDLEPADIPDWLQEKSPDAIRDASPEFAEDDEPSELPDDDQDEDFIPDWLADQEDSVKDEEGAEKPPRHPQVREDQASAEEREITDITPRDLEGDFDDEEMDDFPEWLKDLKSDEEEQETAITWLNSYAQESPQEGEDIPAADEEDFFEPDFSPPTSEDLEEPDWMQQESPESTGPPSHIVSDESREDELLDDDDSAARPETDELEDELKAVEEEKDELETDPISEFEQGEGLIVQDLDEEDDFPDWLDELDEEKEDETAEEIPAEIADKIDTPPSPSEPSPSLEEPREDIEPEAAPSEPSYEDQDAEDDLPTWLDDLDFADDEDSDRVEGEPHVSATSPDSPAYEAEKKESTTDEHQKDDKAPETAQIPTDDIDDEVSPQAEVSEEDLTGADFDDEDATLAWLEGLAEKQGADQEDFVTSAEERAHAEAPDVDTEEEYPQDTEQREQPSQEDLPKADMPDWLAELEPTEETPAEDDVRPRSESEAAAEPDLDQVDADIEDEEDLPGWLEELGEDEEEVFASADDDLSGEPDPDTPKDEERDAGEIPDWLGELESQAEAAADHDRPAPEDGDGGLPSSVDTPREDKAADDEEDDMAWLESLAGSPEVSEEEELSSPEDYPQEQVAETEQKAEEDITEFPAPEDPQQDEDLPGWMSELEETEGIEPEEAVESSTSGEEFAADDDDLDWLADLEEAEDEGREFMTDDEDEGLEGETAFREDMDDPLDPGPSKGMLKRLGELDEEQDQAEAKEDDEVPEWLTDFKEEEDPQETAVLWLRKYVESGGDVDLEKELQEYTDSLGAEEVPEWVQDLQEEEDPTSTAMLWLERLEQEEAFRRDEERKREERSESDWLAELEKEEQHSEQPSPAQETRDESDIDDEDWLSELEEEDPEKDQPVGEFPESMETEQDKEVGEDEDVPPWMLATSPLEGDLLTGDLIEESEEEEIPDWLAGYEEEEEAPLEDGVDTEEDEYAWLSAYDEGEQPLEHRIDLNNAPISQLESLIGITFEIAEAIVSYRDQHGPFQSLDDLQAIPAVQEGQVLEILQSNTMIAPQEQAAEDAVPDVKETEEDVTEPEMTPEPAEGSQTESSLLDAARKKFKSGDIDGALEDYEELIDDKENIEQVIDDLSEATYDHPMNVEIIKTLGDAYMRIDKLQEALDAYSKAEDLIR